MSETPHAIPEQWIKGYVDQLLDIAGRLDAGSPMHAAVLLRVDHTLDLVKAWRERKQREKADA